jgi:long-chain fatty acid transport protein
MKTRTTLKYLPLAIAAAFSGGASAAGFQLLEQNASGIGNAYAGSAAIAENASTIFFNPAGMTRLQSREASVGASAVRASFDFKNTTSSNAPAATGTDGDGGGDWALIPNAYLSMQVADGLYVGLGLGAPFGLATEYDDTWVGRFQSTKFEITTINLNPSVAYKVSDTVSVGGGISYQKMDAEYQRFAAVAVPAVPALTPAAQATKVTLAADDAGIGWNVGAMFQLSDATRLGVSYRSKIDYTLEGTLTSTNQTISPNVGAKADLELPDTFILSVAQRLGNDWELLGDLSWTGWSSIQKVDIIRTTGAAAGSTAQTLDANFDDTWRVALGAGQRLNDAWKMKYGVAWDQSPVRSDAERLVSLPDNDRLWLSVGAQWTPAPKSVVDFGFAYLIVKDTGIDNNQTALGRGRVTGTYDSNVVILGAQYSMAF